MATAYSPTVVFRPVWVVLKVQNGGEERQGKRKLANTTNVALGLLVLVLAYLVYPRSSLVALGVGLVGAYIVVKGLRD
jgi:hypothetical protein